MKRILVVLGILVLLVANAQAYRRGMTMITPATQWIDALPSGNGMIGAMVYGSVNQERVLFNHNELWYGGKIEEVPDVSAELPVVRQLMQEGKYREANNHYQNKLRQKGFSANNARYHPAFDMLLTTDGEQMFEDYARTLDFETGEVAVEWRDGDTRFSRRLFVSIPDDVVVMSIKADRANAVSGRVTLDIHDLQDAVERDGSHFDPGFTYQTRVDDGFVEFRADGSDGGEFGGVLRVVAKHGEIRAASGGGGRGRRRSGSGIRFEGADEVLLIVGLFANEKSEEAVPRLKEQLAAATGDYEHLFDRHQALHRQRFNAMGVSLVSNPELDTPNEILLLDAYQGPASPELVQRLFDYGRYLLISSSRAGGYPANLQGLWNGDYRPAWNSLLGINENLQMTYWHALPGNLKESIMAFYDYFDGHMDEFRYNAKQLWGCQGIYIPPFMSPESGIMRMTAPHVLHWTDAAGWLASFYYDYYLLTGDLDFLKNRAVPFMKEVALFYEDYMVQDEDGKNMFFPSQSPENEPRGLGVKVQMNSTIAVAIAKEVFGNLVEACELLGIEEAGVARWKQCLDDMPAYQVNEDGALREWLHPDFEDNYEHRHQSHIYPLFPGQEITAESDPDLYEACKVAIEKRLTIGLKSQTGWSLAHMANVYARLGDGERAKQALDILSRACLGQNLFTYHNDWRKMGVTLDFSMGPHPVFQMDANFGVSAAITEMLCGSSAGMLSILPALPSAWSTGEFHGMLTRAGVMTSAQWDMAKREIELTLQAQRDTTFDLKLPGDIAGFTCSHPERIEDSERGSRYRAINLNQGQKMTLHVTLR